MGRGGTVGLCCAAITVALLAPLVAPQAVRSRTLSAPLPEAAGGAYLLQTSFTLVEFHAAGVYPVPALRVRLVNDTWTTRQPMRDECARGVRSGAVAGTGYRDSPESGARHTGDGDASGWQDALFGDVAVDANGDLQIDIRGQDTFILPVTAIYYFNLSVPAVCTLRNIAPPPLEFTVTEGRRSTSGRVMTFVCLLAASISVLGVLGGSLFVLLPVQVTALIMSSGCAPVVVQEESVVMSYVLVPLQPRFDGSEAYRFMLYNVILLAAVLVAEGIHLGVRIMNPAYAKEISRVFSNPTRGQRARVDREAAAEDGARKPEADDVEEAAAAEKRAGGDEAYGAFVDDGEDAAGKASATAVVVDKAESRAAWRGRRALPMYVGACVIVGLSAGSVQQAVRSLITADGKVQALLSVGTFCFNGVALPLIALGLTRNRNLAFKPYVAVKDKLPRWLQPMGLWGPNAYRLSLGVFINDFRDDRKGSSSVVILYQTIVAVLTALTPSTLDGCRNILWTLLFFTFGFTAFLYTQRPFRSKFLNHGHIASVALLFLSVALLLAHSLLFAGQHDHWSVTAFILCVAVHSAHLVVMATGHVGVAAWEVLTGVGWKNVEGELGRAAMNPLLHGAAGGAAGAVGGAGDGEEELEDVLLLQERTAGEELAKQTRENLAFMEHVERRAAAQREQSALRHEEKGGGVSLAEYLASDYEMLPAATKREQVLLRGMGERQKPRNMYGVPPMLLHASQKVETYDPNSPFRSRQHVTIDHAAAAGSKSPRRRRDERLL
jgi:hypothetical protein